MLRIGQKVRVKNGYGIDIGEKIIVGISEEGKYYLRPTDTPWYSWAEDRLTPVSSPDESDNLYPSCQLCPSCQIPLLPRENPDELAAWCGTWEDCPRCHFSALRPSDELILHEEEARQRIWNRAAQPSLPLVVRSIPVEKVLAAGTFEHPARVDNVSDRYKYEWQCPRCQKWVFSGHGEQATREEIAQDALCYSCRVALDMLLTVKITATGEVGQVLSAWRSQEHGQYFVVRANGQTRTLSRSQFEIIAQDGQKKLEAMVDESS